MNIVALNVMIVVMIDVITGDNMLHILELLAQCMIMILIIPIFSIILLTGGSIVLYLFNLLLTKVKRVLY